MTYKEIQNNLRIGFVVIEMKIKKRALRSTFSQEKEKKIKDSKT